MNHLLCFVCALTLSQAVLPCAPLAAADPTPAPLVTVVLDADFRPEAQFRIAEALRRPPLDWNMMHEQPAAKQPQVISPQYIAADILAIWDELWKNNPLHAGRGDTIASHCEDIWTDLACSHALAEEARASSEEPRAEEVNLSNLPRIHTGEQLMAELTQPPAEFPLDPYGYDEYNQYFEPEVYDWFVFITDDLSVVYVHDISDLAPANAHIATTLDTPEYDLAAAANIAEELNAGNSVPDAFPTFVREAARKLASGGYDVQLLIQQTVEATDAMAQPVWDRYVRRNDLFRNPYLFRRPQIAKLPDLLRF